MDLGNWGTMVRAEATNMDLPYSGASCPELVLSQRKLWKYMRQEAIPQRAQPSGNAGSISI